jgi:hypothetical protein
MPTVPCSKNIYNNDSMLEKNIYLILEKIIDKRHP